MLGPMKRYALPILAFASLAAPAWAQNEPFRVVNGTRQAATALNIVRAGQDGWGANILTRGPLAAGDALSMRPPEGAGCRFDIRLTLADGQEAIRRNADVCTQRMLVVGADAPTPRVGGSD
jgi:serine protease Do